MGALRAAELAAFGMVGVGQIFEWYRDGVLEDDDDVAVAHEDASRSYRLLSDAMVNVRATLARAVQAGVLDAAAGATLAATVKATAYSQRNLRRTLGKADLPTAERNDLARWLERNGIFDQKRADAEALFKRVANDKLGVESGDPTFRFSYTEVFHELVRSVDTPSVADSAPPAGAVNGEDLLEELQLCGLDQFRACWLAAVERALARALARTRDDDAVHEAALAELPSVLQDRGVYESLVSRAAQKSCLLESDAYPAVRVASAELVAWHFSVLARPVPEDLDAYARAIGFVNPEALILAIARERWYADRQHGR
jgi:hypothetical protein